MVHLNPIELAVLGFLDGPLWSLTDLEEALCPQVDREEVLRAIAVLREKRLIEEWPGRAHSDRFFLATDKDSLARVIQRQEQIALFKESEAAHA